MMTIMMKALDSLHTIFIQLYNRIFPSEISRSCFGKVKLVTRDLFTYICGKTHLIRVCTAFLTYEIEFVLILAVLENSALPMS